MRIDNFVFLFLCSFVFSDVQKTYRLEDREAENDDVNQDSRAFKAFRRDLLEIFPYFNFKESNVYKIIAFFKLQSGSFKTQLKQLDGLQAKYYYDLEVVRYIFFLKHVLCYVHYKVSEYSDMHQKYLKVSSFNSRSAKYIQKIVALFRDKYYSNSSDYCIDLKESDHEALRSINNTDEYLDLVYELMMLSKEKIMLDALDRAVNSRYGMSWVESLWYSAQILQENQSRNLDIYFYNLIEFFEKQDLVEYSDYLKDLMISQFPDTDLF